MVLLLVAVLSQHTIQGVTAAVAGVLVLIRAELTELLVVQMVGMVAQGHRLVEPDKEQLLMSLAIVHLPSMLVAVVPEHLVAQVVLAVLVGVETARLAIVQRVVQLRQILAVVEAERVAAKLLQVAVALAV